MSGGFIAHKNSKYEGDPQILIGPINVKSDRQLKNYEASFRSLEEASSRSLEDESRLGGFSLRSP
jgi:hypothetical protein